MSFLTLELAHFLLALILLLAVSQLGSNFFSRFGWPRVMGEIMGGLVLGPSLLGAVFPKLQTFIFTQNTMALHGLVTLQELGLLFHMFCSGIEVQILAKRGEKKSAFLLALTGLSLPFVLGTIAFKWIDPSWLMGPVQDPQALGLVFAIAVSVTSIPVISRILMDLKLLSTKFSRIVLSVAVFEDLVLFAVLSLVLAKVPAQTPTISKESGLAFQTFWELLGLERNVETQIFLHIFSTVFLFIMALTIGPKIFHRLSRHRLNLISQNAPLAFGLIVLFSMTLLGLFLEITPMFGAFLAGMMMGKSGEHYESAKKSIKEFAFSTFIPIYFASVGLKLNLIRDFNLAIFLAFLMSSTLIKVASIYLGARWSRHSPLDSLNLGVALNARGGPGIVLASITYSAGIINGVFFATLVLTALVTSLLAGVWLQRVKVSALLDRSIVNNIPTSPEDQELELAVKG